METDKKIDRWLFFGVMALVVFGLVMISSAGVAYSQSRFGDSYYFFKRQLLYGILPGLLALYFFQKFDYRRIKKFTIPLFMATLILLTLVFIPGIGASIYGANRWLQLGPISFQPSEMAKLATILYLAAWLESKGKKKIKDFFEGYVPFLGIIGVAGFLIIKQPDTGTLGILVLVSLSIYFASGANISHLLSTFILGIIGLLVLIKIEPYRMNRFSVFLNPEMDPRGIGYQINQALLALGTGGIFGLGIGHSRQKFNYLPEPVGDSIFAIIGEELGLLGAVTVIGLFLFVAVRGFFIAKNAPDDFGKLTAVGITSWIIFQAFINIAAMTSLIPLTGVPLPFVSYGGTSLVFLMAGVGILLNISKHGKNKV
jgi:cell division protein FtsW